MLNGQAVATPRRRADSRRVAMPRSVNKHRPAMKRAEPILDSSITHAGRLLMKQHTKRTPHRRCLDRLATDGDSGYDEVSGINIIVRASRRRIDAGASARGANSAMSNVDSAATAHESDDEGR